MGFRWSEVQILSPRYFLTPSVTIHANNGRYCGFGFIDTRLEPRRCISSNNSLISDSRCKSETPGCSQRQPTSDNSFPVLSKFNESAGMTGIGIAFSCLSNSCFSCRYSASSKSHHICCFLKWVSRSKILQRQFYFDSDIILRCEIPLCTNTVQNHIFPIAI